MNHAEDIEPDPEDPYCVECGNDEPRRLGAIHNRAGHDGFRCTVFRCRVCGHHFSHSRRYDGE